MSIYAINKNKNKEIKLKKLETRCLYLDEIIDIKFIGTNSQKSKLP